MRQRPGSARGVLFITLEDETGIANLVVWSKVFEQNRRAILSSSMMAVRGRIQREGEVVHLVVLQVANLSAELASISGRRPASRCRTAEATRPATAALARNPRDLPPKVFHGRDLPDPHGHIRDIKVKTRDFR